MALTPISSLPKVTTLGDADLIPVSQGGSLKAIAFSDLRLQIGGTRKKLVSTDNYVVKVGESIALDSSAGVLTLKLPSAPVNGDEIPVSPATTWTTHNPTIDGNGKTIEGQTTLLLDTDTDLLFRYNGTEYKII